MIHLNEHLDLRGKHALLSPSRPSFFNSDPKEAPSRIIRTYSSTLGTDIHEWASIKIERCHKITSNKDMLNSIDEYIFKKYYIEKLGEVSRDGKRILYHFNKSLKQNPEWLDSIRRYINDSIGFRMYPEVVLFFNNDFFGCADALIFNEKERLLRIHDLKTGVSVVHIEQLMGYAALFCLEQHMDPSSIEYELRIYQGNDILIATPTGADVKPFVDWYLAADAELVKFEGELL